LISISRKLVNFGGWLLEISRKKKKINK
jgi:hypothetical protein